MSKTTLLEILNRELEKAKNIVYSPSITTDMYKSYWQGRMYVFEETIQTVERVLNEPTLKQIEELDGE